MRLLISRILKKKKIMNLFTKQKETHRKQTYGYQEERRLGRINWECGVEIYTQQYLKIDDQQGPIVGFPGGRVVKNPSASALEAGDVGSTPGLGRCPGEGNGNPLQYSCLGNPTDSRARRATVSRFAESRTRQSNCARRST